MSRKRKDPAYDHWKSEVELYKEALRKLRIIKHDVQMDAKLLNKYITEQYGPQTRYASKQLRDEKEIHKLNTEKVQNRIVQTKQKFQIAKRRCSDPIFKYLCKIFPLTILEILCGYHDVIESFII